MHCDHGRVRLCAPITRHKQQRSVGWCSIPNRNSTQTTASIISMTMTAPLPKPTLLYYQRGVADWAQQSLHQVSASQVRTDWQHFHCRRRVDVRRGLGGMRVHLRSAAHARGGAGGGGALSGVAAGGGAPQHRRRLPGAAPVVGQHRGHGRAPPRRLAPDDRRGRRGLCGARLRGAGPAPGSAVAGTQNSRESEARDVLKLGMCWRKSQGSRCSSNLVPAVRVRLSRQHPELHGRRTRRGKTPSQVLVTAAEARLRSQLAQGAGQEELGIADEMMLGGRTSETSSCARTSDRFSGPATAGAPPFAEAAPAAPPDGPAAAAAL